MKEALFGMAAAVSALATAPALACDIEVLITGEVEFNQIGGGALGNVNTGDPATLAFMLDSENFLDSASFPTRGYVIDADSFTLALGAEVFGLQDPFPPGSTPFFVLRDNDPAVDGFFTATSVDFPIGVPIDQEGIFGQFTNNYAVSYVGETLSSLDIFDAVGTYDFGGLKSFLWTINDGQFKPLSIVIEQLTITAIADCGFCEADVSGNGTIDVEDLVIVVLDWGCTLSCQGDVNQDGVVDVEDLVTVILLWGPCP